MKRWTHTHSNKHLGATTGDRISGLTKQLLFFHERLRSLCLQHFPTCSNSQLSCHTAPHSIHVITSLITARDGQLWESEEFALTANTDRTARSHRHFCCADMWHIWTLHVWLFGYLLQEHHLTVDKLSQQGKSWCIQAVYCLEQYDCHSTVYL
jgi:hypothetical protein